MRFKTIFLLSRKKLGIAVILWFILIILHNILANLLKAEELFFFILAVLVVPTYFAISILYTLFHYLETKYSNFSEKSFKKKRKPKRK